jgi:malate dehydrogenase (oxaloacetate-decarboxylating)
MRYQPLTVPDTGERYLAINERGEELLLDPLLNKGTAFTPEERTAFGLHGLLPDHVQSIDEQLLRVHSQMVLKIGDLGRNIYLNALMDRNETLFYRYVLENLQETVPVIYTPTVAQACSHWSRIYRQARGLYITPRDRGRISRILRARSFGDHPVIVVTDNERILGIGDQGAGGMGIPIGKLALYTTAAGIHPSRTIPISLDVGTNNPELLADPLYLGYRERRLRGEEYDALIDEFVRGVKEVFPGGLLQWEDFANRTSFTNLERYRKSLPSFNDDIQGTAAMVVGGLIAATRHVGRELIDHQVVIAGAGSAGAGIHDQMVGALVAGGMGYEEAHGHVYVLDSRGLLMRGAGRLTPVKEHLAVEPERVAQWSVSGDAISLHDVVANAEATVLIGASGNGGLFDEDIIRTMGAHSKRPIIMPLSNPTKCAEVTPANALRWTDGRAVVATGSPFPPVDYEGQEHRIGQGNNVFVFPGMGLGVLTVQAREITDGMFLAAAEALAEMVSPDQLKVGQIYPDISEVRGVSRHVAVAVARQAIAEGVADAVDDAEAAVSAEMWVPDYLPYRPVGY